MSTIPLFGVEPVVPEAVEKLSPDRRRTHRQAQCLARGQHPLSLVLGSPLRLHEEAAGIGRSEEGRRCGSCAYRRVVGWHSRSYGKCVFGYQQLSPGQPLDYLPRVSHGAGTDIRAWWPACADHEYGDPGMSADAARHVPGMEDQ